MLTYAECPIEVNVNAIEPTACAISLMRRWESNRFSSVESGISRQGYFSPP